MQWLVEFFPILLFFIAYKFYGIYIATMVAMIASGLQITYTKIRHRKWDGLQCITFVIILLLGSATLYLHNPIFIKLKPTIVFWVFGLIFLGSQWIGKKTMMQYLMDKKIALSPELWKRLNLSWVAFFFTLGLINLYLAFHLSTEHWVYFKLFGVLGSTILFSIGQTLYLMKHIKKEDGLA